MPALSSPTHPPWRGSFPAGGQSNVNYDNNGARDGGTVGIAGPSRRGPGGRPGRGGLYDSVDTSQSMAAGAARRAMDPSAQYLNNGASYDPASDGRGGIAGLRDPYDRPTRSHLKGAQSRLRQDKSSRALDEVSGRYRALFGGHHVVRKGLRRSIADAYAAYVGQVVNLPDDTYGLALRALDHTFNTGGQPTGAIDLNLRVSPYATSPAKHAQIFNAAHKIMRDLEGYVHDVSYYCPSELDELREMRRPGGGGQGGETYRSGPRVQSTEPPLQREAVTVAPRYSTTPGRRSRSDRRPPDGPPNPDINPITGAMRSPNPGYGSSPDRAQAAIRRSSVPARPGTAPPARGGGGQAAAAAAARSVAAALDASASASAVEQDGGGGPEEIGPEEQRQRRNLRRLSSPGMFVKTPPHYRVAKYYEHVSPTEDVLKVMRQHALEAAEQQTTAADVAAAAAAGDDAARGGAPEATMAVMQQVLSVGTRRSPARGSPSRHGPQAARQPGAASRPPEAHHIPPYDDTERILWIIETAYELGLAEVLGLEGPAPYARSRRLSPIPYRRQFYDAVYSSPERYGPYTGDGGGDGRRFSPPPVYPYPQGSREQWAGGNGAYRTRHASPPGYAGVPYGYDGPTARRVEVAAARRYVREMDPPDLYPRSRRMNP